MTNLALAKKGALSFRDGGCTGGSYLKALVVTRKEGSNLKETESNSEKSLGHEFLDKLTETITIHWLLSTFVKSLYRYIKPHKYVDFISSFIAVNTTTMFHSTFYSILQVYNITHTETEGRLFLQNNN